MRLLEYQRQMAYELLGASSCGPEDPRDGGFRHSQVGMHVHRGTILSGLVNAMRTTFTTVARLLGDTRFGQVAAEYALTHRSTSPVLFLYGESLPEFLGLNLHTRGLRSLPDVARFDFAIDRTAHQTYSTARRSVPLSAAVELSFNAALECLKFDYPVDLIRAEAEIKSHDRTLDRGGLPAERYLAVWRSEAGASVKPLSGAAALFLEALIAGADGVTATERSIQYAGADTALVAIRTELFSCSCIELRNRTC